MGMGINDGLSFGGLVLIGIILAAFLVPIAHILHRAGRSRAWCLLFFVPFGNLIGLWAFAYTAWPAVVEKRPDDAPAFH